MLTILNAFAKTNNINLKKVSGSISADPIGFLALNSHLPVKMKFTFDRMSIASKWSEDNSPKLKTIGVSGYPYSLAGSNAVQELAYVMASAVEYLNQLTNRGISVNEAANNMRFTFSIGSFYFMEIAKLRAARVLWSNILDVFGADDEAKKIEIHGKTSLNNQTMYDPYVNMLRTTTEAFSAIVGGVDSLHTNPFNESFAVPDEFARRIARNTQIILDEESHLSELIDPAGGSYYVESLTQEVADAAWNEFKKIEDMGGIIEALKSGYIQNKIESVVASRIKDIKKRKNVIVGTNMYVDPKEKKSEAAQPDHEELYKKRVVYLQDFRVKSNVEKNKVVVEKLHSLVETSSADSINIGTEALLAGATLGEISHAARATTEESISIEKLNIHLDSQLFVDLRNSALEIQHKTGSGPKVFLANMGKLKQYKARADFSRSFFEVGGFEVIYSAGFDSTDDAVKAALDSGSGAVVICSTDDTYPDLVKPLVQGIKQKRPGVKIILAGYPKDQVAAHKEDGVDNFIYLGADVYAVLSDLLNNAGGIE
jgi:methylmalonyl-CoA mutase